MRGDSKSYENSDKSNLNNQFQSISGSGNGKKNFVGPGCPRMKLWTELVRAAVRAEVPDYEVMQTMAMFLGGLENNDVGDDVIRRLAIWFRFDPVTWLKLMGNITNLDVLLCH